MQHYTASILSIDIYWSAITSNSSAEYLLNIYVDSNVVISTVFLFRLVETSLWLCQL